MKREVYLPNLGCDYVRHYQEGDKVVVEYAVRPGMHGQALKRVEIEVDESAPEEVRCKRLTRKEEIDVLTQQILDDLPNEPKPTKNGETQNYTLKDLQPGSYYVAIRSWDEFNNRSAISNVVKVIIK